MTEINKNKKELKEKVMKLLALAESFNLTIAAGVTDSSNEVVSFCSNGFDNENEILNNIYLMIKSKGDISEFMLEKSRINTLKAEADITVGMNPQVLNTRH